VKNATRIGLALLFASSMLVYVERILIPYQKRDAETHNRPRGNLSDLYPRWLGARELLLHGRDPYSSEITREIQTGYYGRPLDPALPNDPKDEQRFAYPVYVVFLLSPSVTVPFDVVQTAFLWLLVLLTAASAFLWLDFLRWRPSLAGTMVMVLLALGSFAVVQGSKLQQLSLLVGFLIALSAALLVRGHLFLAGVFMALSMIKPQLAVPVAGWLFLWAMFGSRQRRSFIVGFGTTMAVLIAASEWLLPGWLERFRDALAAYQRYTAGGGVLETLFSPIGGKLLAALLVLAVLALCWRFRRASETGAEFQWITSLVLTVTVVIIPTIAPYNQVLLLPGVLVLARQWPIRSSQSPIQRALSIAACLVIAWPWLATTALTFLSAIAPAEQVQKGWGIPLASSLFIPVVVMALQLVSFARRNTNTPERG
jgi:hypothetical protein